MGRRESVPHATYLAVMGKYEGRCQHPRCGVMSRIVFDGVRESYPDVEYSHILSRGKYPEYATEAWNGVSLCPFHHRLGPEAVHVSHGWERYYYRLLPENIQRKVGYSRELSTE